MISCQSNTYQNKAQGSSKYLRVRIQAPIINMQLKYSERINKEMNLELTSI